MAAREISLVRLFIWQFRLLRASLRPGRKGGAGQKIFFAVLGLLWMLSVGIGVHAVLGEALRRSPEARWIPALLLYSAWLGSLAMTLFFNLGLLLHVIFFSPDLAKLMVTPVDPRKVLAVRFIEAMWSNMFFSLFLSLPTSVAVGIRLGAPPGYYLVYVIAFLGFLAIPVALTYLIGIPLARWVPTSRLRAAFSIMGFFMALGVWSIPYLVPVRLTSYREWQTFLSRGQNLYDFFESSAGAGLPSSWAAGALVDVLHGQVGDAFLSLGLITGVSLGLSILAIALSARSYLDGWIRLLPVGETQSVQRTEFTFLLRWLPRRWRPIFWKDITTVGRDFRISFQLYSLGILMCLFPFISIMSQGMGMFEGSKPLVAFSSVLGATVVVASQAGMMTVPLEGRAGFRLLAAPLGSLELAAVKWLVALLLSLPIVAAQIVLVSLGFQRSLSEALSSGVLGLAGAMAGAGFGVFMGVTFANFDWDHPKRMVRSGAQIGWGVGVGGIVVSMAVMIQIATITGEGFAGEILKPLVPLICLGIGFILSALGIHFASRKLDRLEWI